MNGQITIFEVAAFTDQKSAGSPTGVVLEAGGLSSYQMQLIAKKLNFSHTAFVTELGQDNCDIGIRFFTPAHEIKNCGHATIATHFLREIQASSKSDHVVRQRTVSGIQDVEVCHREGAITVYFKQPEISFCDVGRATVAELLSVLKLPESALNRQYPISLASPGAYRFMVALNSSENMGSLKPNFSDLKNLCERLDSIGCFVFTLDLSKSSVQAMGRMFAPAIGIEEDIVNGNSSGCLAAYLLRLGKESTTGSELTLSVHQGHAFNRPGKVLVMAKRVGDKIETIIGGTAVIVSNIQVQLG